MIIEYEEDNGSYKVIDRKMDFQRKLGKELTLKLTVYKKTSTGRATAHEIKRITKDFIKDCDVLENEQVPHDTQKTTTNTLISIFVVVILFVIIVVIVYFTVKWRRVEEVEIEDFNPEYGCDYGEAEIKDRNDYYFSEEDHYNIQTETSTN